MKDPSKGTGKYGVRGYAYQKAPAIKNRPSYQGWPATLSLYIIPIAA